MPDEKTWKDIVLQIIRDEMEKLPRDVTKWDHDTVNHEIKIESLPDCLTGMNITLTLIRVKEKENGPTEPQ